MLVRVRGDSMSPTLVHGDRVLVSRVYHSQTLSRGEIVVLRRDESALLPSGIAASVRWRVAVEAVTVDFIKRLVALPGDPVPLSVRPAVNGASVVPAGLVVVLGDNIKSADSRSWGFVPAADVLGVVRAKVS